MLEDKWYAFADWVVQKLHIPLDKYFVNPLEDHGIPSFPVAVVIAIALIGGIAFLALGGIAPSAVTLSVSVTAAGEPVDGAQVSLAYGTEKLEAETVNGIAEFANVPTNQQATLTIDKTGYTKVTKRLKPSATPVAIRLELKVASEEEKAKDFLKTQGYTDEQLKSMPADEALRLAQRLGLAVTTGPMITMYAQVEEPLGDPVSDASIVYEAGSVSDAATTDSDGKAMINVPDGSSVTAAASKDGYETKSARFTASADATQKITLRKQETIQYHAGGSGVPSPDNAPVRYASVKVRIRGIDPATNESLDVPNATVTLFTEDNRVINSTNGSSASDVSMSAQAGYKVYASVEATGFALGKSTTKTVEADKVTTLPVFLEKARCVHCPGGDSGGNVDPIMVNVKTQTGRPVSGAKVFLFDAIDGTQYANKTTSSNGAVTFSDILLETKVIAVAMQPNFVTNVSSELEIGLDLNATLTLGASTDNNSAKIDVTAIDFPEEKPVAGAYVSLKLDGVIPLLGAYTDGRGKVTLADLPTGINTVVKGEKNVFSDEKPVSTAAGRQNVTLTLLPSKATVTFKAVDFFTGADLTLNNPSFTVYFGSTTSTPLANCSQTNSEGCQPETPLFSIIQYALRVTADGYIPATSTFNAEPGSAPTITARLVPTTNASMVIRGGLYDFDGTALWFSPQSTKPNKISYAFPGITPESLGPRIELPPYDLEVGKAYYLEFAVYMPPEATEAGFYIQAGDKTSVLADDAGILRSFDWNPTDTVFAEARGFVTSTRGFTATACGAGESANGLYKSVFLKIENNGNNSGTIPIRVPFFVTSKARPQVTFSYSAYVVLPDGVMRSPADAALGSNPTAAKKWCKTTTHNLTFQVVDPNSQGRSLYCGLESCVELSYAQQGGAERAGTGYAALVPLDPTLNPISVDYSVFDFNLANPETPTSLKITIPPEKITLDLYDPETRNQYTYNVSGAITSRERGKVTAPTRTAYAIAPGLADLFYDYGEKVPQVNSYMLLYGETHATLQNTYYISYDESTRALFLTKKDPTTGELKPLSDFTSDSPYAEEENTITLYTDPIMPGDAVHVRLDYDSLPANCRDTEIVALPLPNCFEYDSTKQLLRFDESSPNTFGRECPLYNVDPNNVTEYPRPATSDSGKIRFNIFCLGINAQEFDLKVKSNPATINSWDGRPAVQVPAVYKSDVAAEGYATMCGELPSPKIYLLANNKQLGSLDYPHLSYNGVLQSVVDKVTDPGAYVYVVNEGTEQLLLLGSSNVTIQDQSTDLNRAQVREILEKTVFRRHDEREQATSEEKGFPYSVFSTRPIKYSWASLRLSSTNDPTSPDWVNNYGDVTECDSANKRGVFIKSVNPRNNTWSSGQVEWNTMAEVAKLTGSQYLQSIEFGNQCGFKESTNANTSAVALCGTSYWSCGGGCVLPNPIVLEDGTPPINDLTCMNDGNLWGQGLVTGPTTPAEATGCGVDSVTMLKPSKTNYYLHTPTCTVWRYWKRGLMQTELCEWLCYSDFMTFEAYDFIEPYSKAKKTLVTCPKTENPYFDGNTCSSDEIKQQMADEGIAEENYDYHSETEVTNYEFSSAIPKKTFKFRTGLQSMSHQYTAGVAYSSDETTDVCHYVEEHYFGESRYGNCNPYGSCDLAKIVGECIYTNNNLDSCTGRCGTQGTACCEASIPYCYGSLRCINGRCTPPEVVCGDQGTPVCTEGDLCKTPRRADNGVAIEGMHAVVDAGTTPNTCKWECTNPTFVEGPAGCQAP